MCSSTFEHMNTLPPDCIREIAKHLDIFSLPMFRQVSRNILVSLSGIKTGKHFRNIVCNELAKAGLLRYLQIARQNGYPWDERTCAYAAGNGHFEVLKWAREDGCPWVEQTCAFAAENGHFEILKWLRSN